jgi:cbb3-type cytochrome oxidase maturation protein
MDILLYIIPIALTLGLAGLIGFFWSLKNNQYDDPKGNAERILQDD